jgi:hypothetical protein
MRQDLQVFFRLPCCNLSVNDAMQQRTCGNGLPKQLP